MLFIWFKHLSLFHVYFYVRIFCIWKPYHPEYPKYFCYQHPISICNNQICLNSKKSKFSRSSNLIRSVDVSWGKNSTNIYYWLNCVSSSICFYNKPKNFLICIRMIFSFQYKNNSDMISSWKLSSVNDVSSMMMKICLFSLMKVQSWKCLFWPFFAMILNLI
jgi:hypothetical protein